MKSHLVSQKLNVSHISYEQIKQTIITLTLIWKFLQLFFTILVAFAVISASPINNVAQSEQIPLAVAPDTSKTLTMEDMETAENQYAHYHYRYRAMRNRKH